MHSLSLVHGGSFLWSVEQDKKVNQPMIAIKTGRAKAMRVNNLREKPIGKRVPRHRQEVAYLSRGCVCGVWCLMQVKEESGRVSFLVKMINFGDDAKRRKEKKSACVRAAGQSEGLKGITLR